MPTITFSEKELEDFLSEKGNLEKYLDLSFVSRQVKTPVGIVDILAYNKKAKKWVIIELKRGLIDESAYFQIQRYFHYFSNEKIGYMGQRENRFVRLLIGQELSEKLYFSVYSFEKNSKFCSSFNTYYALFGFDFSSPLSFDYINTKQQSIQDCDIYVSREDEDELVS